jgi:hypothetical protein
MTLTMSDDRRRMSLVQLRQNVLSSKRFDLVSAAGKMAFFYDYLTNDLYGMVDLQLEVLGGTRFASLSRDDRARLVRLTAGSYLARNERPRTAKALLWSALSIKPTDVKTVALYSMLRVNPALARNIMRKWQAAHKHGPEKASPFAALQGSPGCVREGGAGEISAG